jgi:hypothetical protein
MHHFLELEGAKAPSTQQEVCICARHRRFGCEEVAIFLARRNDAGDLHHRITPKRRSTWNNREVAFFGIIRETTAE